jgi:hypothetical protein
MRLALLSVGAAALFFVVPATSALGTVDQFRDSDHHEVFTEHDFNICGNPGTFTFDVTSHLHTVDNGNAFVLDFHESYTYTLVFDDPALGTWTAHAAENTHFVVNRSGSIFQDTFNSREGPIQIIQHRQFHTDADGNATVVRTFEKIGDC